MAFQDRIDAGWRLAQRLSSYRDRSDVIVLGLPRGGVPVAFEVAKYLNAPLDIILVRKLGVPGHEELGMGAIASGGVRVLNPDVIEGLKIATSIVDSVVEREQEELVRRESAYRGSRPPPDLESRTVIVVDDGLATGSTMRAAVHAIRKQNPAKVVVAVPVGAAATCDEMRSDADEVVCLLNPHHFYAVGMWYEDFSQTTDDEIRELLERPTRQRSGAPRT